MANLVRFDWAIKRLLRNKADYCIVEGLLTSLMGRAIRIQSILESEGNKEAEDDKFNRVDLMCEDDSGELMIFEIQQNRQLDYFHRMTYGTSKVICEYMKEGEPYSHIRKVYSINIVYFSIGQGKDYAYHGTTQFVSMHNEKDVLRLSSAQRKAFGCEFPSGIFPEYYLLRVDNFDEVAKTPLDEWVSFLKTGDIPATATAPGLAEARERLRIDHLSDEEKRRYHHMMENLSYQRSVFNTSRFEGYEEGMEKGMEKGMERGMKKGIEKGIEQGIEQGLQAKAIQIAKNLLALNMPIDTIANATGLAAEEIEKLKV